MVDEYLPTRYINKILRSKTTFKTENYCTRGLSNQLLNNLTATTKITTLTCRLFVSLRKAYLVPSRRYSEIGLLAENCELFRFYHPLYLFQAPVQGLPVEFCNGALLRQLQ